MKRLLPFLAVVLSLTLRVALARADPVRILVAASSPVGYAGDPKLVHPADDAGGVREVFTTIGRVRPGDALLVPDATAASVRAAFDRAAEIARAHTPDEVSFLFYFSGHGDREALHLAGELLPLKEVEERVARMPAALRLVVIDACRVTSARAKGMTSEPAFALDLHAEQATTGTAWLFASSDGEVAQESDEVGGALFSHFWTTGLRGAADADGDGRVTLEESFDFAYAQTLLRSARSGAVLQRPRETVDLSRAGPVVLTELATSRAMLVLPPDRDALYLAYATSSRSLVSELFASPDRPTALSLPAGRYLLQRRVGDTGGALEVILSPGERRSIDSRAFHPFAGEALALKGELLLRPWSITAFDGAVASSGPGVGDEGGVEVERRWGDYAAALRVLVGWTEAFTPKNYVFETSLGGEASVVRVLPLSERWTARLGLDARAEWIHQQVKRRDAAFVEGAGYPGSAYFGGGALGGGAHADVRFDLSVGWFVGARVNVIGLGAMTDTGVAGRLFGAGSLAIGVRLP